MLNSPQPMLIVTITLFIFTTDRSCYTISISEIEAVLCLQAFCSVSALPYKSHSLKIVVLHACQSCIQSLSNEYTSFVILYLIVLGLIQTKTWNARCVLNRSRFNTHRMAILY